MQINYEEYKLNSKETVTFILIGYIGIALILMLFYDNLFIALIGGLLAVNILPLAGRHLAGKRKELLERQFRDFLDSMASSVATGRNLEKALEEAYASLLLIYAVDTPLCLELEYINHSVKTNNANALELLKNFAQRSGSDAHSPRLIQDGFDRAVEYLNSLGFKYYCTYKDRKPAFHSF